MNQSLLSPKGFLEALHPHADKPLVFAHGGECIRPGYHVTEVRAARVQSLDCGGHPESWAETLVQLWDPPGKPGEGFMPVSKFLSVYGRVAKVPLEGGSRLLFEWGDASTPAVRYTVADLTVEGGAVVVHLSPVYAACKPKLGVTPTSATASSGCCSPRAGREAVSLPPAETSSLCCG